MQGDAGASGPGEGRAGFRLTDAQLAVDVASGKWVLPILELLDEQSLRRGELRRLLGGDTHQKVLTLTLQRMVAAGLITRIVLRPTPPAVRYELTDRGRKLFGPLAAMAAWAAPDRDRLSAALDGEDDVPSDVDEKDTAGMERSARPASGQRPGGLAIRRALSGTGRGPRPRQALVE